MLILLQKQFPLNVESDAAYALNEILSTKKYVQAAAKLVEHFQTDPTNADEEFYAKNPTLFVYQNEVAVLPANIKDQFKIIASDKATSCHIVIIRSKKDGKVGIGHFDRPSAIYSSMKALTDPFGKEAIDLHIIGGYDDSETVVDQYEAPEDLSGKVTANGVSISVLQYFIRYFKGTATLKTFCANILNDYATYKAEADDAPSFGPVVRGCGIEVHTGKLIPGSFKCYDLSTQECSSESSPLERFVPEFQRRSTYGFQLTSSNTRRFENIIKVHKGVVFLELTSARYKFPTASLRELASKDPVKDKEWILMHYSTTPDLEDDDFAAVLVDCARDMVSAENNGNMNLPKVIYKFNHQSSVWEFQPGETLLEQKDNKTRFAVCFGNRSQSASWTIENKEFDENEFKEKPEQGKCKKYTMGYKGIFVILSSGEKILLSYNRPLEKELLLEATVKDITVPSAVAEDINGTFDLKIMHMSADVVDSTIGMQFILVGKEYDSHYLYGLQKTPKLDQEGKAVLPYPGYIQPKNVTCNEKKTNTKEIIGSTALIPPFQPDPWNDTKGVLMNNNCYNYSTNIRTDTFAQPGRASGRQWKVNAPSDVASAAIADGLEPVHYIWDIQHNSKHELQVMMPEPNNETLGRHYVALLIWPGMNFHWIRQNSDGTWSSKDGDDYAFNTDINGNTIVNPCDLAQTRDDSTKCNFYPYTELGGIFIADPSKVNIL